MVGCDYMEVIFFSVSVNHVNGSHLDFTFLIPYGLYLLLCSFKALSGRISNPLRLKLCKFVQCYIPIK